MLITFKKWSTRSLLGPKLKKRHFYIYNYFWWLFISWYLLSVHNLWAKGIPVTHSIRRSIDPFVHPSLCMSVHLSFMQVTPYTCTKKKIENTHMIFVYQPQSKLWMLIFLCCAFWFSLDTRCWWITLTHKMRWTNSPFHWTETSSPEHQASLQDKTQSL